jgi:Tol biopolymer transport system component
VLNQFTISHGRLNSQAVLDPPRRIAKASATRPELPLAYSPNGRSLLVFRREPTSDSQFGSFGRLYVRTPAGSMVRVGSQNVICCYLGSPASWSPDGRRITYAGFVGPPGSAPGLSAVFVADANGSHARQITPTGAWTTSAHWSPHGDWIVYDKINPASAGGHEELLVSPDGSRTRLIPTQDPNGGGSCCAQWSPNGRYLAYQHVPGNTKGDFTVDLYVVNVTGPPRPTLVVRPGHGYLSFAWLK